MIDIIIEVFNDSIGMLPVLFLAYLFIEWYEHKNTHNKELYSLLEKFGPIFGALLGIIPQCGFSVVAATLFVERKITIGTLISVFIATSDEAIPILISDPSMLPIVGKMILIKIVAAIGVGYLCDLLLKKYRYYKGSYSVKSVSHEHHHSIWKAATKRTLKIFGFIVLINLILTTILSMIGEEQLSQILFANSIIQPVVAAIFGFIPNCIASVLLSELYTTGYVSFGALMAGLMTNAGLGLMVLLNYKIDKRAIVQICGILFVSAVIVGTLLTL